MRFISSSAPLLGEITLLVGFTTRQADDLRPVLLGAGSRIRRGLTLKTVRQIHLTQYVPGIMLISAIVPEEDNCKVDEFIAESQARYSSSDTIILVVTEDQSPDQVLDVLVEQLRSLPKFSYN